MAEILRLVWTLSGFGALAFAWAGRRVDARIRRSRWIKFLTYLIVVHVVLGAVAWGHGTVVDVMLFVALQGFAEVVRATRHFTSAAQSWIRLMFATVASLALFFSWAASSHEFLFLYVTVAVFDGFSQAGGQLLGRTRIAPRVSPGKTVEGLLSGTAIAILCAWHLRGLVGVSAPRALTLGLAMSACAFAGDLSASWVKRSAGLKDFGRILPGHGGILDRFDGVIAAAAMTALVR